MTPLTLSSVKEIMFKDKVLHRIEFIFKVVVLLINLFKVIQPLLLITNTGDFITESVTSVNAAVAN